MIDTTRDLALVFPGQGSQFVGMGVDLCAEYPEARAVFDRADVALGSSLSRLCFGGPAAELDDTSNTQPAIYTATLALWAVLTPRLAAARRRVAFVAGHSLGEFSALAVAGALDSWDGLVLVRRRGEAMRDAGHTAPGGMLAILGLSDGDVAKIVAEVGAREAGVWVANCNAPGQVVVAGTREGLARAADLARERGAKRVVPLAVSVASHTPLMAGAAQTLSQALGAVVLQAPWAPVVSNALAVPLSQPDEIRAALIRQLTSPVRWTESVLSMAASGVKTVLEVGPRSVLCALIKRIAPEIKTLAVTDAPSVRAFSEEALQA